METTKKMIEQCPDLSTDERKVLLFSHGFAGNRIKSWVKKKLPDDNYKGILGKAAPKLRAFKKLSSEKDEGAGE